jgi:asparagine synthase (glutamine-hydrolysing)
MGSFDNKQKSKLLTPKIQKGIKRGRSILSDKEHPGTFQKINHIDRLIYVYLKTYLINDILVKLDRASMYNSLEARTPFLDPQLVNYINSLPVRYKIRGKKSKYLLKETMKDKLPSYVIDRPKKGFGPPLAQWIIDDIRPLVLNVLSENKIKKQGIFNYNFIDSLLKQHFNGRANNYKLIWNLFVFQYWYDNYYKSL